MDSSARDEAQLAGSAELVELSFSWRPARHRGEGSSDAAVIRSVSRESDRLFTKPA
jgi:hypothetical protein